MGLDSKGEFQNGGVEVELVSTEVKLKTGGGGLFEEFTRDKVYVER